jgi:CO/xanthine dehydrogenase FAD-binding subunit
MLKGKKITENLLEQVGSKASEEADPVADIHASEEYRRHLVKALTKRTVKKAWENAQILAH